MFSFNVFYVFIFFTLALVLFGFLSVLVNRRSLIVTLMGIELVFLSSIAIIAVSAHLIDDSEGLAFALLAIAIIAADTAIGITVLTLFFKNTNTTAVDDISELHSEGGKW